jgi:hypothetical protein
MLAGLVEGTRDPAVLAELAKGQLRKKLPQLREALEGRFRAHHALLVGELLAHIEYLEDAIERLSQEVERHWPLSRLRSSSWTPSPASTGGPRKSSWLGSGLT